MFPEKRSFGLFVMALFFCAVVATDICAGATDWTSVPLDKRDLPESHFAAQSMAPNGGFEVQVRQEDKWETIGTLAYDQFFREQVIEITPWLAGEETARIRLVQKGGGAAHIDSVSLGGSPPEDVKLVGSATPPTETGPSEEAQIRQKISQNDYDVMDAFGQTVELTFPVTNTAGEDVRPVEVKTVLQLVARVEGLIISKFPFQFPLENLYRRMNIQSKFYKYRLNSEAGVFKIDGDLGEIASSKPFFKEYSLSGSGHPSDFTYGWVRNDNENLYVAIDFTGDNTMDGDKDYAKVYAKTVYGLKEFKVSVPERKWGSPAFTYTDKVTYQHKVYEFRIPLGELGVKNLPSIEGGLTQPDQSQEIQLAFAAYGTLAPPPAWELNANSDGDGKGILISSTPDICSGDACYGAIPQDPVSTIVITAVPTTNSVFAGWEGCDDTQGNQCTVTLDTDRMVTATFSDGTSFVSGWTTLGGELALSVSADGAVVAMNGTALRWENNETIPLGNLVGGTEIQPNAVTADGRVIVGYGDTTVPNDLRAFRWTEADGMTNLGTMYPNYEWSYANGVSSDGAVVVGHSCDNVTVCRAFRWTEAGGLFDLGTLGGTEARAYAVSGDGSVVVGWSYGDYNTHPGTYAFRWTQAGGMVDIDTFGGTYSRAFGVSADGNIVVGGAENAEGAEHAFRWSAATGMVDLGTLGGALSSAWGISADGSVIVGESLNADGEWQAFRWTAAIGMQSINDWLADNGVEASLVPFTSARGVSADGSVVVGQVGGYNGDAFIARVATTGGMAHSWGRNNSGQLGNGTILDSFTPIQPFIPGNITAVSAGSSHTLAVDAVGGVWAWGNNGLGELGDGTITDRTIPVRVKNADGLNYLSNIVAVSAGFLHSLALDSNGRVWAWGQNDWGQLGQNPATYDKSALPLQVAITDVAAISAGQAYSMALKTDGTVWAWGVNDQGQLGIGSLIDQYAPVQVSALSNIVSVSAGWTHALALNGAGNVWAWGKNEFGQLGMSPSTPYSALPAALSGLGNIAAVSAGLGYGLALDGNGSVWAWGGNWEAQLGDGTTTDRHVPAKVKTSGSADLAGIRAVSAGRNHGLALDNSGKVWAWGANDSGQLGNDPSLPSLDQSLFAIKAKDSSGTGDLSDILAISAGNLFNAAIGTRGPATSVILTSSGNPALTGAAVTFTAVASSAITGTGTPTGRITFKDGDAVLGTGTLDGGGQAAFSTSALSTGNHAISAIYSGDSSFTSGTSGVLTQKITTPISIPAAVPPSGMQGVSYRFQIVLAGGIGDTTWSITGGRLPPGLGLSNGVISGIPGSTGVYSFTVQAQDATGADTQFLIIRIYRPGSLDVWGDVYYDGDLTDIVSVSAGEGHGLALDAQGGIWAWGEDESGQLGDGNPGADSSTPVQPVGLDGRTFAAVAAGGSHSLALESNGAVWIWGVSDSNLPAADWDLPIPMQVEMEGGGYLSGIVAIALGRVHATALSQDGTVYAFGNNYQNQLGQGTGGIGASTYPIRVKDADGVGYLRNIAAISARGDHNVALASDGSVYEWGRYELWFDNNAAPISEVYENNALPVKVKDVSGAALKNIVAVSAGDNFSLALDNLGHVWSWGHNDVGQLGRGDEYPTGSAAAVQVRDSFGDGYLSDIVTISAGSEHSLALDSQGWLWTWGDYAWLPENIGAPETGTVAGISAGSSFSTVIVSSMADMTTFGQGGQVGEATIDGENHTVALTVVYGTDVTSLVVGFTLSPGASAQVGGVEQVSGETANDFTNPVTYTVVAADNSVQDWTVSVHVAPQIPAYLVTPSAGAGGAINPNTPQTVSQNATTSFTVTPDTGYHLVSVTGCGGALSGNTYTTGPITADCPVAATFATANRPPIASADAYVTFIDTPLAIPAPGLLANDSDPDGDSPLGIDSHNTSSLQGSLTVQTDGSFSYTPPAGWTGTTSFAYRIFDYHAGGLSDWATVSIVVTANHPPVAVNDSYIIDEDTILTLAPPVAHGNISDGVDAGVPTITVPDDYPTIQAAVTAASDGDIILVRPGIYHNESVFITKSLTIRGEDKATTILQDEIPRSYTAFKLQNTTGVNIENFTIRNYLHGVYLVESHNNRISNNHFEQDSDYSTPGGISANLSHNNIFTGNSFSNNQYGIHLWFSDGNTIGDNAASSNNGYGIHLEYSSNNVLSGNTVSQNRQGIYLEWVSENNTIVSNTLKENEYNGLSLKYSSNSNLVINNSISDNNQGVLVEESSTNTITRNTIRNNGGRGIYIYQGAMENIIYRNLIENNLTGIDLYAAHHTRVYNNNFINNTTQAEIFSSASPVFNLDEPVGGNYWNDWTAPDNDGNGFVDNPYHPFSLLVEGMDYLPWMTPDGWLPLYADSVLDNDADTDGDSLSAILASSPSHGTLTFNSDGSLAYTPHPNWNGTDSFTYKISDGEFDSDTATVTITVNPINDAPVAAVDAYSTFKNTALIIAAPGLLTNDSDPEGDSPLTVDSTSTGALEGSLTAQPDGSFSYTPPAGWTGTTSFDYRVFDYHAAGVSDWATVSIAVNPVYTVSPSIGAGGTIDPSTPQTVGADGTISFTVTPEAGYHLVSVTGCGGSLSGNTYTTGAITDGCAVTATFAITGNIDPDNGYAWSENVGWINFGQRHGPGVIVTDSGMTGYAWGENIGWIDLAPAGSGVTNDGEGNLSGYAWGENVGWINFAPAGGGVSIDAEGNFNGTAWGENIGWITFSSTGPVAFGMKTSWTAPPDMTPLPFDLADQTGGAPDTLMVSNPIVVSGIEGTAAISIEGGEYEINGNGIWTTADGTVNNNDTVRVRLTTSHSYATTSSLILTIGGVSETFSVTTSPTHTHALTVTKSDTGTGSVTSNAGTLTWIDNIGTGVYDENSLVILTAAAEIGSAFESWSGCDSVNGNTCTVAMTAAKNVIAGFTLRGLALSFPAPLHSIAGQQPRSVAVWDFNGDGRKDLAVANFDSDNVSILLGKGNGTFQPVVNYPAGNAPQSVTLGDFNEDGKKDVAVANGWDNQVSILSGNGDGTFQPRVHYALAAASDRSVSIAVADFNRDGNEDIAFVSSLFRSSFWYLNELYLLLGNGDGTFQPAVMAELAEISEYALSGVVVGDFNADGKKDLVVKQQQGGVAVILGNGDGTFQTVIDYESGGGYAAIGDFNADGVQDLALGGVAVLLGNGNGTFQQRVYYEAGSPYIVVGDFNGDGEQDLVSSDPGSSEVSLLLGKGDGTFQPAVNYVGPTGAMAVADFNEDGKEDIAVAQAGLGAEIILGNGDGSLHLPMQLTVGDQPRSVVVGDFNGDGKDDLAVVNSGNINGVSILLGNGDRTFQPAVNYAAGLGPVYAVSGDFNTDGKEDLAVATSYDVVILFGNGDGTFQAPVSYAAGEGPGGRYIGVGDFNGDGKEDLSVAFSGSILILLGNGDGTFPPAITSPAGDYPWFMAVGDFNTDGKKDLAVGHGSNSNHEISILLGNADGTFQAPVYYTAGQGPGFVAVGDFNGDGKEDLAAANLFSKTVSILLGSGDGTFQGAVNYSVDSYNSSPRSVTIADFNADGKEDLIVANDTTHNVSILLGNGDGTFQSRVNYAAGERTLFAAVGDFNRDGKQDVAVSNYNTGRVRVLINASTDVFPDLFTFADQTGVPLNSTRVSDAITASNIRLSLSIAISSCTSALCEYSVNGGVWTSGGSTVNNGDTILVRQKASGSYSATTHLTLSIGGVVSDTFSVTTLAQPDYDGDGIGNDTDPDDDNDGMPDEWENLYGLNRLLDDAAADADGDGYTNYEEYLAGSDPSKSASMPFIVLESIPHEGAGVDPDETRISNTASFAVHIRSAAGVDLTDPQSIVFTVIDGAQVNVIDLDFGKPISLRIVLTDPAEDDQAATDFWAVYDRLDHAARDGRYPYGAAVQVTVDVTDVKGIEMEPEKIVFTVETESQHADAHMSSPPVAVVAPESPDLVDPDYVYDAGIEVTSGELAGCKIIYNSSDPVQPVLGPTDELPPLVVSGVNAVGVPMNLQPPTVFATPVKLLIPCPGYVDASALALYMYNGREWVPASDAAGNVLPGGVDWMEPGSRVNHNETTPATIEIKVYHFTGVQAADPGTPNSALQPGSNGAECFIATATYGSVMAPRVGILRDFKDRIFQYRPKFYSLLPYLFSAHGRDHCKP